MRQKGWRHLCGSRIAVFTHRDTLHGTEPQCSNILTVMFPHLEHDVGRSRARSFRSGSLTNAREQAELNLRLVVHVRNAPLPSGAGDLANSGLSSARITPPGAAMMRPDAACVSPCLLPWMRGHSCACDRGPDGGDLQHHLHEARSSPTALPCPGDKPTTAQVTVMALKQLTTSGQSLPPTRCLGATSRQGRRRPGLRGETGCRTRASRPCRHGPCIRHASLRRTSTRTAFLPWRGP